VDRAIRDGVNHDNTVASFQKVRKQSIKKGVPAGTPFLWT